jgi:hypothetical protein
MIVTRSNVNVNGDACDVHARIYDDGHFASHSPVAWCGVYVRASGPVNGYWYFPQADEAASLLVSLGAMPNGAH